MSVREGGVGKSIFLRIDPREIIIDPGFNPRTEMDLEELMPQIAENGVQEPVRVHKREDGYHLVNGGRRVAACLKLIEQGIPIKDIPAIVLRGHIPQGELLLQAVMAHEGKPFTKREEAEMYRRFVKWGWSQAEIARECGKPHSHISQRLLLLEAEPVVRQAYDAGEIGYVETLAIIRESHNGRPQEAVLHDLRILKAASSSKRVRKARPVLSVEEQREANKIRLSKVLDDIPMVTAIEWLIEYYAQHTSGKVCGSQGLIEDCP